MRSAIKSNATGFWDEVVLDGCVKHKTCTYKIGLCLSCSHNFSFKQCIKGFQINIYMVATWQSFNKQLTCKVERTQTPRSAILSCLITRMLMRFVVLFLNLITFCPRKYNNNKTTSDLAKEESLQAGFIQILVWIKQKRCKYFLLMCCIIFFSVFSSFILSPSPKPNQSWQMAAHL